MRPEEIAAYIGAAAWLPQIGTWLYRYFATPHVTIIPARSAELGFTALGPILNIRLAFSSDRRDAIVNEFRIRLTHEDGDQHEFRWVGMKEIFSEITDEEGNRQVVSKDQTPIAFKIGTDILLEKFVRFQEPKFDQTTNKLFTELLTHFRFLKENDPDFVNKTLQSKQFKDFVKAHMEAFWWKHGKYTLTFHMESPRKLILEDKKFYFTLDQIDIEELRHNLTTVEQDISNKVNSNLLNHSPKKIIWNWRHPSIIPEE